MLSVWCLIVAFFSPWVVGAPFAWLLRGCRRLRGPDWLLVPFVGLAAIVCPLQVLLVFGNLPLSNTVPGFWATLVVPWGVFLAFPSGRGSFRTLPVRVVALSAVAYLTLGAGLLRQGVEHYRGKLQSDQFYYVVLAQALTDVPYTIEWSAESGRPWLALTRSLKGDRLGQTVVHGFFAVTAGRDAIDLFYPTLFLAGALLVPGVRLLASRVGLTGRFADTAAVAGALVPSVGVIVSECYLSHALFVPILVAYTAVVARAVRRPAELRLAAILFALGLAVYTEFAPLLIGVGGATALAALAARQANWRQAVVVASVPLAGVLLNLPASGAVGAVATRVTTQDPVSDPTQSYRVMAQSVWMDSLTATAPGPILGGIPKGLFAILCFSLAGWGWISYTRSTSTRRTAVLGGVGSLMLLPCAVLVLAPGMRYGIFKLLVSAGPFYALGVCLAARLVARGWWQQSLAGRARLAVIAVVVVGLIGDTLRYQQNPRRRHDTDHAAEWNCPEMRRIADRLNEEPPGEVVVALGPGERTWIASGSLMYRARRHCFRVESPRQVWLTPLHLFPARLALDGSGPPRHGAFVVTRSETGAQAPGAVVLRTNRYVLIQVDRHDADAFARGW